MNDANVKYLTGTFKDFNNVKRSITVCCVHTSDNRFCGLALGVAIQNPEDADDPDKGKMIAFNRAQAADYAVESIYPGMIREPMMELLLKQELDYVKRNPGKYIGGYEEAKKKHDDKEALNTAYRSLTDEEKAVVDKALSGFDFDKCLDIAFKLRRQGCQKEQH